MVGSLPKPNSVGGVVEVEMQVPNGTFQISNYHWDESREAVFKPDVMTMDMALLRGYAPIKGLFLERPGAHRNVGDLLVMPPNYTLHTQWDRGDRRSVSCTLDTSCVDDRLEIDWSDTDLYASLNVSSNSVRGTLLRIVNELQEPRFASDILIESLGITLMVELHRHFSNLSPTETAAATRLSAQDLRRIREVFEDRCGQAPTVYELARDHNMSVRHFSRLFRHSTGETISEFAARIFVGRAKALLEDRRNLIKQIAYDCGFKSTSAFSSAFRRATGLTPQQFRAAILN